VKLLVAPLELKGTLSAAEAADAMCEALADAGWDGPVDVVALSDGGPGFTESLRTPRCLLREARVHDPLLRELRAPWLQDNGTALLEMASACGLSRLAPEERAPAIASTFGVGELILSALDLGCTRIVLGAGGSATNDGGAGAAEALGVRLLDSDGQPLGPGGAELSRLARVDLSGRDVRLAAASIEVATDVQNPLLGPAGASRTYGPQKGAGPAAVEALEEGLARLEQVVREALGIDCAREPGMGAAGGLAYGLSALCGARVTDGFELASTELRLSQRIREVDCVLTAVGQLDAQTLFGKGPYQIALRSEALGRPCVAFVGRLGPDAPLEAFSRVVEVSPTLAPDAEGAREEARAALRRAVGSWARGQRRRG
jgi:glycerate kinase